MYGFEITEGTKDFFLNCLAFLFVVCSRRRHPRQVLQYTLHLAVRHRALYERIYMSNAILSPLKLNIQL